VGVIAAVRVMYEYQGAMFELVLPQSLEVYRPDSDPK
jgi:hypothetical protein